MAFKKVTINREGIIEAIKNFDTGFECIIIGQKGCIKHHIKKDNSVISKLNVYPLTDGKTTISWQECNNPKLSEEIALHIINTCKFPDKFNTAIYIKRLEKDKLNSLIEYLIDYCNATLQQEIKLTNGTQYKIRSFYGDIVSLNHFTNNAFNVQGPSGLMKSQVIEGLSAYLDYGELVDATLVSYNVDDIDANSIKTLFNSRLPVASEKISDTIKCIIMPVFVLERLKMDDDLKMDFSYMVFPILRGLEGCIKELFLKFGVNIGNNIGGQFQDHTNTGIFTLIEKNKSIIKNIVVEQVLNKMYNYHKNNRHAIFHVDDTIITTRLIDDVKIAQSLINETFELIEMCYIAIKEDNIKYLK